MYRYLHVGSVRLAWKDFGGEGPAVLLLHGLFGRATTWEGTAAWLRPHFRVVGLDQRGHGLSDKPDGAYSRDDYVDDAVAVIEALRLQPAIVIGHSMGALNAWVLAARRPDLVRALVLEDMTAATARPDPGAWVRDWLSDWPLPFSSMAHMRAYFGQPVLADYFSEVMAEDETGYHPRFRIEHMVESSVQIESRDHWEELDQVRCPTLVVRGAESEYRREDLQAMAARIPGGRFVEVPQAGHVVHYDQPVAWRMAVEPFLLEVKAGRP